MVHYAKAYRRSSTVNFMLYVFYRYDGWFVDLYARVSNAVAIGMYRKSGYSVYQRVKNYYAGIIDEDAYGEKICRMYCTMGSICANSSFS
jgi:ribosomal protein S18 acetylase RimI-like enzyme